MTRPAPVDNGDLVVVGGGPAGMAASLAAADLGCAVTLVDAEPRLGGQIFRRSALTPSGAPDKLPARFRRLAGHPLVQHLGSATVWHAEAVGDGFLLRLDGPPEHRELRARAVVLATGAAELTLPFPGWTLPGVTTAGAAQTLLKAHGTRVGRRVLVAGSGPFLLPVAAALADAGVHVLAVLEASLPVPGVWGPAARLAGYPAKVREAGGYTARLTRNGVLVRAGWGVVAAYGDGQVKGATVAWLDGDWRVVPGSEEDMPVDAVCVSYGFVPALELPRALGCSDRQHVTRPLAAVWHDADQATSVPGVFVAGELTGIGGADVAALEGELAGASVARFLGRLDRAAHATRTRLLRGRLNRARRFARLLDQLYPFRTGWRTWPRPDTVACRCEETTWQEITDAVAAGFDDVRSVKGVTRCGMGYCQGRVCGPALQSAVAAGSGRSLLEVGDLHTRTIGTPVPLELLTRRTPDRSGQPEP